MRRAARAQARLADDEACAREHELRRARLVVRRKQTAGVIEMQVAQHDDVDVFVRVHRAPRASATARARSRARRSARAASARRTRRCRSRTAPSGRPDPRRASSGTRTRGDCRRRARATVAQRLRGTLPNIAPPSRRWLLPSTDQSRTRRLLDRRVRGAELQLRETRVERARQRAAPRECRSPRHDRCR